MSLKVPSMFSAKWIYIYHTHLPELLNPLEIAVLQSSCKEQLSGALLGDLQSSSYPEKKYEKPVCLLNVCSAAVLLLKGGPFSVHYFFLGRHKEMGFFLEGTHTLAGTISIWNFGTSIVVNNNNIKYYNLMIFKLFVPENIDLGNVLLYSPSVFHKGNRWKWYPSYHVISESLQPFS